MLAIPTPFLSLSPAPNTSPLNCSPFDVVVALFNSVVADGALSGISGVFSLAALGSFVFGLFASSGAAGAARGAASGASGASGLPGRSGSAWTLAVSALS